jgi:isopentenyldiphosphate isomerase
MLEWFSYATEQPPETVTARGILSKSIALRRRGQVSINELHEQDLVHRAVRIVVIDSRDRILMLRRESSVTTCPGAWTLVGEHRRPAESVAQACHRGVLEELGAPPDMNFEELQLSLLAWRDRGLLDWIPAAEERVENPTSPTAWSGEPSPHMARRGWHVKTARMRWTGPLQLRIVKGENSCGGFESVRGDSQFFDLCLVRYDGAWDVQFDDEVMDSQWASLDQLSEFLATAPESFCCVELADSFRATLPFIRSALAR